MTIKFTKTDDNFIQVESDEIQFSKEELKKIKEILQSLDQTEIEDEELKKLKEKKQKSGYDKITKGLLFIECLDKINEAISQIEEKDKNNFEKYLISIDSTELRNLIEKYHSGFGSYFSGEKIKDIVKKENNSIDQLINIFFELFGGEE